jgi:hypothetical protein
MTTAGGVEEDFIKCLGLTGKGDWTPNGGASQHDRWKLSMTTWRSLATCTFLARLHCGLDRFAGRHLELPVKSRPTKHAHN